MSEIQSAIDRTIRGQRDPAAAKACSGKVWYPTIEAAAKQAKALRKDRGGKRFEGYKCRYCDGFHVGHSR